MTRTKFIEQAIRDAERKLYVPSGWWGTYRDVRNATGDVRVYFSSGAWIVSHAGKRVLRHISRTFAIDKARKLMVPK